MAEEEDGLRKRRTHAINEIDDQIDLSEFRNVDEDDDVFGEVGEDGKVVKEES